jgi:hypothetical protein
MYAEAVQQHGVRAVFAFPLQTGAVSFGVMDVFRTRAGRMSREDLDQSLTFAAIAGTAMLDGQHDAADGAVPQGFDDASAHRPEVFQAQGMVMVQLGIALDEALVRLRAHAYAAGRPLADVARDVVNRRLRFDRDRS